MFNPFDTPHSQRYILMLSFHLVLGLPRDHLLLAILRLLLSHAFIWWCSCKKSLRCLTRVSSGVIVKQLCDYLRFLLHQQSIRNSNAWDASLGLVCSLNALWACLWILIITLSERSHQNGTKRGEHPWETGSDDTHRVQSHFRSTIRFKGQCTKSR